MPLPAKFAHLNSLLDLVVDVIVREIEQGADMKTPVGAQLPAGVNVVNGDSNRANSKPEASTVAR
jgi:hypothetical protein